MFKWVLNTPLKIFLFPFHYRFLINISSRSYLCISSGMYIVIIFVTKKNLYMGCNHTTPILSKPFKFFWIIISIINEFAVIKLDCWISFPKWDAFTGINRHWDFFVDVCESIGTALWSSWVAFKKIYFLLFFFV